MDKNAHISNQQHINRLVNLRRKQVSNLGVEVVYSKIGNKYGLYYSKENSTKLQNLIGHESKSVQLYSCYYQPIVSVPSEGLQFDYMRNIIVFKSRSISLNLSLQSSYFIAPKNPTLNAQIKALKHIDKLQLKEEQHQIVLSIRNFIENPHIKQVCQIQPIIFQQNEDMNSRQNQAIQKVGRNALTFIKGPPGCGKTKTIARLCRMLLQKEEKVLVGAVSNAGCMAIFSQLMVELQPYNNSQKLKQIHMRFNSPKTQDKQWYLKHLYEGSLYHPTYPLLIFTNSVSEQCSNIAQYYSVWQAIARKILQYNPHYSVEYILYELNELKKPNGKKNKQFYQTYLSFKQMVIDEAILIISTACSSQHINIKMDRIFMPSVAILDQASQAQRSDTMSFLNFFPIRLVLVGDEMQLQPTVINQDQILKKSVMVECMYKNPQYFVMLIVQYRMHPQISAFPNRYFYNNQLINGVQQEMVKPEFYPFAFAPISFYQHERYEEIIEVNEKVNYYNSYEVEVICSFLQYFPLKQLKNVAILTPYAYQVTMLNNSLYFQVKKYELTICTLDGYQGGEKDYVFISLVRSNEQNNIGFISETKRINVGLTRAKKGLLIIGNSNTIIKPDLKNCYQNLWQELIIYLYNMGRYYTEDVYAQIENNYVKREKGEFQKQKQKYFAEEKMKIENKMKDKEKQQLFYQLLQRGARQRDLVMKRYEAQLNLTFIDINISEQLQLYFSYCNGYFYCRKINQDSLNVDLYYGEVTEEQKAYQVQFLYKFNMYVAQYYNVQPSIQIIQNKANNVNTIVAINTQLNDRIIDDNNEQQNQQQQKEQQIFKQQNLTKKV